MVKRSCAQSQLAPRRRSWRVISPPDCAFHSHTCSRNASRPISARLRFWLSRLRSTTIWVAIPAWSVPTTHKASLPSIRSRRVRTSCSVMSSACPMCSDPVTLGGGMTIVHGFRSGRSGRNSPALSQCAYQRSSIVRGSKVLGSSLMAGGYRPARFLSTFVRRTSARTAHPGFHPVEHLIVPLDRVLWLQHPVVLIGEHHQPRRDVAPL